MFDGQSSYHKPDDEQWCLIYSNASYFVGRYNQEYSCFYDDLTTVEICHLYDCLWMPLVVVPEVGMTPIEST